MRRAMRKPRDITCKRFSARLAELNNYFPLFPVSNASNKMPPEDLNAILLHVVLNGWANQAYIQVWGFEMKSYKATCKLFKIMEVA